MNSIKIAKSVLRVQSRAIGMIGVGAVLIFLAMMLETPMEVGIVLFFLCFIKVVTASFKIRREIGKAVCPNCSHGFSQAYGSRFSDEGRLILICPHCSHLVATDLARYLPLSNSILVEMSIPSESK